jgi:enoyl-CoA hydratase
MVTQDQEEVVVRKEGLLGRITLNRQKALNALSHSMINAIADALTSFLRLDGINAVMIDAVEGRAFCAGGDVVGLSRQGREGRVWEARRYWLDEYALDWAIANSPKPCISIMGGIVMGGGVGLGSHCAHRIVTERTVFALPECRIGLIPDVGTSFLLAKAPGYLGEYFALTGIGVGASDMISLGFADVYVPSERIASLTSALSESGDPSRIAAFSLPPPSGTQLPDRREIDAIFSAPTLSAVGDRLARQSGEWARRAEDNLLRSAPLSLAATLEAIRRARDNPRLDDALRTDFRFVSRAMEQGEFLEGVRAALIEKDHMPRWRYPRPSDLPPGIVGEMLAPLADFELDLPMSSDERKR